MLRHDIYDDKTTKTIYYNSSIWNQYIKWIHYVEFVFVISQRSRRQSQEFK